MNSRERLNLALNHQEPDRIPFDLGATVLTSIHHKSYNALRKHLGLPEVDPQIVDIFQQIVTVDDDMRDLLKVDVRDVAPRSSATFRIDIKEMEGYTYFYDEWGIGWKMPKEGGWYYDMFDHPLKDAQTIADIENYPWPDPVDQARFAGMAERGMAYERLDQLTVELLYGVR